MNPFYFLILLPLLLCGCVTIGQKEVPHGVAPHDTKRYTETTNELYNAYEYLDNNRNSIEDSVQIKAPIIANENLTHHETITGELIKNSEFNYKYTGKPIQGTGLDLSKPIGIVTVIGIIAGVVLFPSIITVVWVVIQRLRKSLKGIVDTIELQDDHSTKAELLQQLSRQLDKKDKLLIHKIKHQ